MIKSALGNYGNRKNSEGFTKIRVCFFSCLVLLLSFSMFAEGKDTWLSFWNKDKTLIGFKDKKGNIKIKPRFIAGTAANKFDDIIAAMEEKDEGYYAYYLTKDGKIAGENSLYMFDNGVDCESEGFIRFRDRQRDKVGMLDKQGEIAIPAEYDDLSIAQNGLVRALKGATKEYSGEHYGYAGGAEYLIDVNNKILIENFKNSENLNLFSVKIEEKPNKESIRQNFIGLDGKYYSFIDYEKEFLDWINSTLLDSLSKEGLNKVSYDRIAYWKEPKGWVKEKKSGFIARNFELIKNSLLSIKNKNSDYFVSVDGLNPYIFDSKDFENYYNNCGEPKTGQYPVMSLIINSGTGNGVYQNQFEFLRTDKGLKLISVSMGNGSLK